MVVGVYYFRIVKATNSGKWTFLVKTYKNNLNNPKNRVIRVVSRVATRKNIGFEFEYGYGTASLNPYQIPDFFFYLCMYINQKHSEIFSH